MSDPIDPVLQLLQHIQTGNKDAALKQEKLLESMDKKIDGIVNSQTSHTIDINSLKDRLGNAERLAAELKVELKEKLEDSDEKHADVSTWRANLNGRFWAANIIWGVLVLAGGIWLKVTIDNFETGQKAIAELQAAQAGKAAVQKP